MNVYEMLEELIDDEKDEHQAVIKSYKENKLEDCDPRGWASGNLSMMSFKKKNERITSMEGQEKDHDKQKYLNVMYQGNVNVAQVIKCTRNRKKL